MYKKIFLFAHSGAGYIQLLLRKAWYLQVYTSNPKRLALRLVVCHGKAQFQREPYSLELYGVSEGMIGILRMKSSSRLAHPVSTVA
ncbi:hypothetical protein TNCT_196821 [Trichonephila clavata]|uniref:Uncharacterized protein n=1 Tax=Trichonephila clavata TaxID=2740835 RepID=A0A8X6KZY9_TRICU|nr:hypothetical protein TNCT_196821 [Trichonephila clavata]